MLYKTKQKIVLDMNTAKAIVVTHGNYTIAFLEVRKKDGLVHGEVCKTIGISKYNPNDDCEVLVPVDEKNKRMKASLRNDAFGVEIALGRALSALYKGQLNNYSVEVAAAVPETLVNRVFVKTKEASDFLKSQKEVLERENKKEVLV